MLSRVAASVHWMSRYLERAENVARFIRVANGVALGDGSSVTNLWLPLVYTTGDHEDFEARYSQRGQADILRFLLFDQENPNSILSCIGHAREAARTVREILPSENWEQLNTFWRLVTEASNDAAILDNPFDFCESVCLASHLSFGVAQSSMLRDEAWSFLQAGRNIERADKTSRIVDAQYFMLLPDVADVGKTLDINRWSAVLSSVDALQMYRRAHGRLSPMKVAEFLILDPRFPRSIAFCVGELDRCLSGMNAGADEPLPSERLTGQLLDTLNGQSIQGVIASGLHAFIDQLQGALNAIGNAVDRDFFDVIAQQRRFMSQSHTQSTAAGQMQSQEQ